MGQELSASRPTGEGTGGEFIRAGARVPRRSLMVVITKRDESTAVAALLYRQYCPASSPIAPSRSAESDATANPITRVHVVVIPARDEGVGSMADA